MTPNSVDAAERAKTEEESSSPSAETVDSPLTRNVHRMRIKSGTLNLGGSREEVPADREAEEWVRSFLTMTNLVVLAGSGCSIGLGGTSRTAPSMWDLHGLVTALPSYQPAAEALPILDRIDNVEDLLSKCVAARHILEEPSPLEDFVREASTTIREACDFVDGGTDLTAHSTFLRKLAHRDARQERLALFTTNYDLAFESALQNLSYTAIDGFGYGSRARFGGEHFDLDIVRRGQRGELILAPNVIRLLKLHGSVDWEFTDTGIRRTPFPTRPVLIYPSRDKYQQSYQQPYLEAMARFQMALRAPDTAVLVVGFGFNDDHLTQPILDAIRTQPTMRMLVVSPDVLTPPDGSAVKSLTEAIQSGDGRLALLAAKFHEFSGLLPERSDLDRWDEIRTTTQRALAHG